MENNDSEKRNEIDELKKIIDRLLDEKLELQVLNAEMRIKLHELTNGECEL